MSKHIVYVSKAKQLDWDLGNDASTLTLVFNFVLDILGLVLGNKDSDEGDNAT